MLGEGEQASVVVAHLEHRTVGLRQRDGVGQIRGRPPPAASYAWPAAVAIADASSVCCRRTSSSTCWRVPNAVRPDSTATATSATPTNANASRVPIGPSQRSRVTRQPER